MYAMEEIFNYSNYHEHTKLYLKHFYSGIFTGNPVEDQCNTIL